MNTTPNQTSQTGTTNNVNRTGRNNIVVPEARQALNQMKIEVANELGISNYDQIDKGNLTARQNGYVGGTITKRLVEYAERTMGNK
ncbi:alpha/beta-type small acid-soluble spore protein [Alkaliphilus peptidifermentans]|uniref:Small, acid-soluble spore protein, alpha/beta type n=1 Tax=Alkaliphilus peptidifermentans DSM 18978 TaxID=1120976 RepID=A0A1G5HZ91_9FIRM|nr:alpha/beta-type small acid-soluble spore protein [Alkaliphilus peptidifermentans]SCY69122.1 Small, acid-soluble spore protein, alpha/beta type [Alkaliphilus peptidifermentans DSM 18978]